MAIFLTVFNYVMATIGVTVVLLGLLLMVMMYSGFNIKLEAGKGKDKDNGKAQTPKL